MVPMQQLSIRVPEELARRLKRQVPSRDRNAFIQRLLEQALLHDKTAEDPLYLAAVAVAVEQDEQLAAEMAQWDAAVGDGLPRNAT